MADDMSMEAMRAEVERLRELKAAKAAQAEAEPAPAPSPATAPPAAGSHGAAAIFMRACIFHSWYSPYKTNRGV